MAANGEAAFVNPVPSVPPAAEGTRSRRVAGLDPIRGVLALIVMLHHGALPPVMYGYDATHAVLRKLKILFAWSWNGQLAVVGFFLISGFCIHYPYIRRPLPLAAFYLNRIIRLALPAAVAIVITWLARQRQPFQLDGIPIWSLWSELIYYAIYPFVLPLLRQGRWKLVLTVAYVLAGCVLLRTAVHIRYTDFGVIGTAIVGFPVWLLGARLAEEIFHHRDKFRFPIKISLLRGALFGVGGITLAIAYWGLVGLGWTLTAVSPLIYFWVREEIVRYGTLPEPRWLAVIGQFSYSIYLMHLVILGCLERFPLEKLGGNLAWAIQVAAVLGGSYLFYCLVERPSHQLSRRAMAWIGPAEKR